MDQASKDILLNANERAKAKRQSSKENTLTSVQSLISTGKMAEAMAKAKEYRGTAIFGEVSDLFKTEEPVIHCEECGQRLKPEWISVLLCWSTPECRDCTEVACMLASQRVIDEHLSRLQDGIEEYLADCDVPKRFLSARIDDFPAKMTAMSDPDDGGWFITGPRGTGKTHLAVALIREHAFQAKYEVELPSRMNGGYARVKPARLPIFVPITELLLEIRSTFNRKSDQDSESEKGIIDRYSATPLLVLDDLGAEKSTDWSMQTLYTLIDRRYRDEMRTIITSNMSLDELATKVDDRIASRIAGMCKIQVLKGKDRRLDGTH